MLKTALYVTCGVVIVTLLGLGLTRRLVDTAENGGTMPALSSGKGVRVIFSDAPVTLPELHLKDLDGNNITNQTLRGKVVLVNFWATWCGPCREEIPMLVALQEHYKDRLVVVGVSIDERPADEVRVFARQFSVNYPIVMASNELQQAFGGISAVPSTFVISPDGDVVQSHLGLLQGPRTEHEVRVLAGLRTEATVEHVKASPSGLLNNAYATEIPGVDLTKFSPAVRTSLLERLNGDHCTCGCNLTLAQCRINDPTCEVSLPIVEKMVKDAAAR